MKLGGFPIAPQAPFGPSEHALYIGEGEYDGELMKKED